jgi:hypothetical protein
MPHYQRTSDFYQCQHNIACDVRVQVPAATIDICAILKISGCRCCRYCCSHDLTVTLILYGNESQFEATMLFEVRSHAATHDSMHNLNVQACSTTCIRHKFLITLIYTRISPFSFSDDTYLENML